METAAPAGKMVAVMNTDLKFDRRDCQQVTPKRAPANYNTPAATRLVVRLQLWTIELLKEAGTAFQGNC